MHPGSDSSQGAGLDGVLTKLSPLGPSFGVWLCSPIPGLGVPPGELLWRKSSGSSRLFSVRAVSWAITHLDKGLALCWSSAVQTRGWHRAGGQTVPTLPHRSHVPGQSGVVIWWLSPRGAVAPGMAPAGGSPSAALCARHSRCQPRGTARGQDRCPGGEQGGRGAQQPWVPLSKG